MTKAKREIIRVPCSSCLGSKVGYYDGAKKPCIECKGSGEVEKIVNIIEAEPIEEA